MPQESLKKEPVGNDRKLKTQKVEKEMVGNIKAQLETF